ARRVYSSPFWATLGQVGSSVKVVEVADPMKETATLTEKVLKTPASSGTRRCRLHLRNLAQGRSRVRHRPIVCGASPVVKARCAVNLSQHAAAVAPDVRGPWGVGSLLTCSTSPIIHAFRYIVQ